MINYNVDGREAALSFLAEWLKTNAPQRNIEDRSLNYVPNRLRTKLLTEKAKKLGQRAKINVQWRTDLSNRLRITEDDILRATNTIVEIMESELAKAGTVRITNFGDFKLHNFGDIKSLRFTADESWKRELNQPLYDSEIGLKHTYMKSKLKRRD